jgi:hypothetical protein
MDIEPNSLPDGEALHRLEEEHRHYSEKLEFLLHKPYLSEEDKLEEVRLKKLKLYVKDQMAAFRQHAGVYNVA